MSTDKILVGDALYKKTDSLIKMYSDGENWETFYLDEKTRDIWVEYYPHSELQGGGWPELIRYEDYKKNQKK
jgi:hypothetical protein